MTIETGSAAFGPWLKRLRAQRDLTQEALAEEVNCSVQSIRFFESGRRRPSRAMAEHLARVLAVPAAEMDAFMTSARAPLPQDAPAAPTPKAPAPETAARPVAPDLLAAGPLMGRKSEVAALTRLLVEERRRLVTLTGMGGMGKTHLALHLAHRLQPEFVDGALFISLASMTRVDELPNAIARALGVSLPGRASLTAQLDELLAGRRLLLVLDNFEHLPAAEHDHALAPLSHVLQHHAGVHLLVTTRERLRLAGEQTFALGGLTHQAADAVSSGHESDAVQFFIQRAGQVAPQLPLTSANRLAIREICARLEGIPLAIELAAAWSHMLTPQEIAAELAADIDFLAGGDRDAPLHHRSLRALFDQSWGLLPPADQRIFAQLAVFQGGFTRAGAHAVTGVSLPRLARLVDKSLVRVFRQQPSARESRTRYDIHSLLRVYLLEKLAQQEEITAVRRLHAAYCVELAEQLEPTLYGGDSGANVQLLHEDLANLRAALAWTLTEGNDSGLGLRLCGALGRFWYLTGLWREGCDWLAPALAAQADHAEPVWTARALVAQGQLRHRLDEYEEAQSALERGLALWRDQGDSWRIAWALFQLATAEASRAEYAQAERHLDESLERFRALGDDWAVAMVLNELAGTASTRGDYARAGRMLDEALPMLRAMGETTVSLAVTVNLLGRVLLAEGDVTRALDLFDAALAITTQHANREGQAWSWLNLGLAKLAAMDTDAAEDALTRALDLYVELERKGGIMAGQEGLAAVAVAKGRHAEARRLLHEAERLRVDYGLALTAYEETLHERTLAKCACAPACTGDGGAQARSGGSTFVNKP